MLSPNPPITRTAPPFTSASSNLPSLYLAIRFPSGDTAPPPPPQCGNGPARMVRTVPARGSISNVPHPPLAAKPETKTCPDSLTTVRLHIELTSELPGMISWRRGLNSTFIIPRAVRAQTAFPSAPNTLIVLLRSDSGSGTINLGPRIGKRANSGVGGSGFRSAASQAG